MTACLALQDTARLRVAWFGHTDPGHGDGLVAYSRQTVVALRARGAQILFFSHVERHNGAGSGDTVELRGLHFKTVTLSLPGSIARIAAELTRFQPDVIHVSLSFSLLDAAVMRLGEDLGVPVVATVHLPYAAAHTSRARVMAGLYRYHAAHLVHADAIVSLSEAQRQLLVDAGCIGDRITVIRNAVDTAAITPGPSLLRSRGDARFIVLYIGRLDPEKRVVQLARSFVDLWWPDDHQLLLAGTGTQRRRLQRLAARHAQVRLLGVVSKADDRLDLLRAADVFVLPSTAEGLSLALLEAMSAGCAVIARRCRRGWSRDRRHRAGDPSRYAGA